MPDNLSKVYCQFRDSTFLRNVVNFYHTTLHHIPNDCTLYRKSCKELESQLAYTVHLVKYKRTVTTRKNGLKHI
jgi:hypothetical protein